MQVFKIQLNFQVVDKHEGDKNNMVNLLFRHITLPAQL